MKEEIFEMPSLLETIEKFEGVSEVICQYSKKTVTLKSANSIHEFNESYWGETGDDTFQVDVQLWSKKEGYAKIVSRKENAETLVLPKSKLVELISTGTELTSKILRDLYPEAFKGEFTGWRFCQNTDYIAYFKEGFLQCFIYTNGKYSSGDEYSVKIAECINKAPAEVIVKFLTNYAEEHSIKSGVRLIYPWQDEGTTSHKPDFDGDTLYFSENSFFYQGVCIFKDGDFAKVVTTISKEDAEKELGLTII